MHPEPPNLVLCRARALITAIAAPAHAAVKRIAAGPGCAQGPGGTPPAGSSRPGSPAHTGPHSPHHVRKSGGPGGPGASLHRRPDRRPPRRARRGDLRSAPVARSPDRATTRIPLARRTSGDAPTGTVALLRGPPGADPERAIVREGDVPPNANAFRSASMIPAGSGEFLACARTGAQRQTGRNAPRHLAGWQAGWLWQAQRLVTASFTARGAACQAHRFLAGWQAARASARGVV
jgi:hypothetical protein